MMRRPSHLIIEWQCHIRWPRLAVAPAHGAGPGLVLLAMTVDPEVCLVFQQLEGVA